MVYRILKFIIGLGLQLFYRQIYVEHKKRLQETGPRIIIANHPNTLMDGWLIGNICSEPIYFMAKGTLFSSPLKRKFLKSLGLVPINRAADGKTSGISNESSFEYCYQLLEKGKTLVVFPEGTSHLEHQLRELKSGTARIALEVERRNQGKLGVKVIPIGLIYMRGYKFRSSVVMNVGEAINPVEYLSEDEKNLREDAKALTSIFSSSLKSLLINSTSTDQEDLADKITQILGKDIEHTSKRKLKANLSFLMEVHNRLGEIYAENPEKHMEIENVVDRLELQLARFDITPDLIDRKRKWGGLLRPLVESIITLFIGLPIFILGVIHNFFPFKFTSFLQLKLVKDIEYHAPVAILLGLILYPITYIGFVETFDHFVDFSFLEKVIYWILMPLTGMFAYYFSLRIDRISYKWNHFFLLKSEKQRIEILRMDKQRLNNLVFGAKLK